MDNDLTYSVVVPVYNSESSLSELCKRIINTLSQFSFEIILIDDSSIDKSWQVITQLKNEYPAIIKAIQLQRNYGQHAALLCGFSFCKGNFTITIDDDLQYAPEDILLLIKKHQESNADVVYGLANKRHHSTFRNFWADYLRNIPWPWDNDTIKATPFRLVNKSIVLEVAENHKNSFISLDHLLKWYTSAFSFATVKHHPRISGKSGYSIGKLFKVYISNLTAYSIVPLKLMTNAGFVFSFIFFLMGCHFVYKKLVQDVPIGYTSIIVAILFCSSITMFCLGIIGQYLFKMHLSNQKKPLYSIKHILSE